MYNTKLKALELENIHNLLVVEDLVKDMIIGLDLMKKFNIRIKTYKNEVNTRKKETERII